MEIVLDGNYDVITHSDSSQLGRNYISEEGTFGRVLVDNLRATDDNYFSFRYRGADYIVYNTTVANDWNCLSVFDATDDFNQLRNLLVYTIIAAVLVVAIQMIIMLPPPPAAATRKFISGSSQKKLTNRKQFT